MTKPIEPGCKAMVVKAGVPHNLWKIVEVVRCIGVPSTGDTLMVPEVGAFLEIRRTGGKRSWLVKGDLQAWNVACETRQMVPVSHLFFAEDDLMRLWDDDDAAADDRAVRTGKLSGSTLPD